MRGRRTVFHESVEAQPSGVARARQLRVSATIPERVLWSRLKAGKLGGLKFRRQHPLGTFIADFYCHEAALVVELDGESSHQGRGQHDTKRDEWMSSRGIRVLRIVVAELSKHPDGVLMMIRDVARSRIEDFERIRRHELLSLPSPTGEMSRGSGSDREGAIRDA